MVDLEKLRSYEAEVRQCVGEYAGDVVKEAAAEIERLRATAHVPAVWDGLITLESEVIINGIRYNPGTYGTQLFNISSRSDDDAQF